MAQGPRGNTAPGKSVKKKYKIKKHTNGFGGQNAIKITKLKIK